MTAAYPDSFVKAGHYPGCTGDLYRLAKWIGTEPAGEPPKGEQ